MNMAPEAETKNFTTRPEVETNKNSESYSSAEYTPLP